MSAPQWWLSAWYTDWGPWHCHLVKVSTGCGLVGDKMMMLFTKPAHGSRGVLQV
jgi:hypothetical protein